MYSRQKKDVLPLLINEFYDLKYYESMILVGVTFRLSHSETAASPKTLTDPGRFRRQISAAGFGKTNS